jgi:ribosomal protein L21
MSGISIYTVGSFSEKVVQWGGMRSHDNTSQTNNKNNGIIYSITRERAFLWSANFGGTANQNYDNKYNCVCADINNNAYAGGHFTGSSVLINNKQVYEPTLGKNVSTVFTTLSNINTTTPESYYMGLIVKYNNQGMCQWAIKLGGNSSVIAMNNDNNNNLYVAGRFYDLNHLFADPNDDYVIDKVLLVNDENQVTVGQPFVEGATVEGKILSHLRGRKIIVYKMNI